MKNKSVKLKIRINDLSRWILFAVMRQGCGYLRGYLGLVGSSGTVSVFISGDLEQHEEGKDGTGYSKVIHQQRHMLTFNLVSDLCART